VEREVRNRNSTSSLFTQLRCTDWTLLRRPRLRPQGRSGQHLLQGRPRRALLVQERYRPCPEHSLWRVNPLDEDHRRGGPCRLQQGVCRCLLAAPSLGQEGRRCCLLRWSFLPTSTPRLLFSALVNVHSNRNSKVVSLSSLT
jgi:hypothetical protein